MKKQKVDGSRMVPPKLEEYQAKTIAIMIIGKDAAERMDKHIEIIGVNIVEFVLFGEVNPKHYVTASLAISDKMTSTDKESVRAALNVYGFMLDSQEIK